ncbi:type II toxin-antitoxin system VapC family toxin [Candidatus Bipolaricaulota sp. J31]
MAKAKVKAKPEIFVDTGAWIALAVEDDAHHREAVRVYPELLKRRCRLLTTNLVVAETYILLRRAAGHGAAISFLEMIEASPRIRKIYSTPEFEEKAFQILKRFSDQDFSFTDAVSFAVMRKEGIEEAFAFDRHFRVMGFRLIP